MKCVCPECKNQIDLATKPNLREGHIIECETCGITLEVKDLTAEPIKVEIVDEGK